MKRILVLVLVLVFLCSCTSEEEAKDKPRDSKGGRPATSDSINLDATNTPTPTPRVPRPTATATPTPSNTPTPTPMVYKASEEIINADVYSGKVQILDTVITLPCKLGELMNVVGVEIEKSSYSGVNGYDPLNDTYAAESYNTAILHMPVGGEVEVIVENLGLEPVAMEDLYVTKINSESAYVFFPKGVCVGTNCAIVREWGENDEIVTGSSFARYTYYETIYKAESGGERKLGSSFIVEVNNSTYDIDAIYFQPGFHVTTDQVTEVTYDAYWYKLKYEIPMALTDYIKCGIILYEGERYIVNYDMKYIYSTADTAEELMSEMGRAMKYYDETGWYATWRDSVDTSEKNNDKQIVQNTEELISVVNYWDYGNMSADEGIEIDGVQMLPSKSTAKHYAQIAVRLSDDVISWEFSVEALDGGEIPEEVQKIFRDVVHNMANTIGVYEEDR